VNAQIIINPLVSAGTNNVTIFASVSSIYTGQTLRLEAEVKCTNEPFNNIPDFVGTPSVVSGNGLFLLNPIVINYNQLCPGAHYKVRVRAYNMDTTVAGPWTTGSLGFNTLSQGGAVPIYVVVSASPSNAVCGQPVTLTAQVSGGCKFLNFVWRAGGSTNSPSLGSGTSSTSGGITTYTITVTPTSTNNVFSAHAIYCSNTVLQPITIPVTDNPTPGVISVSSTNVCDGDTVNLTINGNSPGTTVNWERSCNGGSSWLMLGSGNSISNVLNTLSPTSPRTCCFRARVKYANPGCTTQVYTNQVCVTVSPKPNNVTANITPNKVCEGEIINLSSNATPMVQGPFSYSWTPTTGVTYPNAQNTTAIAQLGTTTYTVTATNQWGCSNTASATINNVKPCPCDKDVEFDYNNIIVNGTEIWDSSGRTINLVFYPWPPGVSPNNIKIKGKIIVMPNATLHINGITLAFGANGMIEIRRAGIGSNSTGGKVVTTDAKLTAVANCMWWGVDVWGWSSELPGLRQGSFSFRNSVMEHAVEGIFVGRRVALFSMNSPYIGFNPTINYSGGTILVNNSTFINCKNSINFPLPFSYGQSVGSKIFGSNFICDAPLRQPQIYASAWNFSQRSEYFIRTIGIFAVGISNLIGTNNTFSNTPASITNSNNNTIGIFCENSTLDIASCNFNNVSTGIYLSSANNSYTSTYFIKNNTFNQSARAIVAIGVGKADIIQNTINNGVWPFLSLMGTSLGVYMNDVAFYSCNANSINNVEHAITALNCNGSQYQRNYIRKNIINNCIQGIALGGDNEFVDIHCNEISNYSLHAWNVYDFPLTSGNARLSDQVSFLPNTGAGNLFNDLGSITDIRVLTSNSQFTPANPLFTYYFDGGWNPQVNPLMPDVYIGPVQIVLTDPAPNSPGYCASLPPIAPPNPADSIRPTPREKDSILADLINTNDTLLQQRYRLELADYAVYYQEDSLLFATLQSINTESAQRLLTGTYIAKEMEAEAAQSLALVPQNTFERQKFHEYINLMRGQIQAGRNVYLSEPQEEQQIRSIAPLKPAPGIHAQNAITALAFEPMTIDCEHLGICDDQNNRIETVINAQQEQSDKISNAVQGKTKITAYPNPTNGTFAIQIDNAIYGNYLIEVIDLRGLVVYKHNYSIQEQSHLHNIRLNEQSKGLYFIKITSSENQFMHISKIVVQ
jgi:hypothetical protein